MNDTQLEETIRTGRAKGVLEAAKAITGKERVALLRLAVKKISFGSWPSDFLDDMIELGDAAIFEALAIDDREEANIISFNMSANLCDCWNDSFQRSRRHFEKGLAYADRALAFRHELGKAPDKVAMAHWARGKHLLSLGQFQDAVAAFKENVACLRVASISNEPESLLAGEAFLGLARLGAGDVGDNVQFETAMAGLKKIMIDAPSRAEDVQMYIDQLEMTKKLLHQ